MWQEASVGTLAAMFPPQEERARAFTRPPKQLTPRIDAIARHVSDIGPVKHPVPGAVPDRMTGRYALLGRLA
jgi:hypothetical protein